MHYDTAIVCTFRTVLLYALIVFFLKGATGRGLGDKHREALNNSGSVLSRGPINDLDMC